MAWAHLAQIQTTLLQSSLKIFMIESQLSNLIIVPKKIDIICPWVMWLEDKIQVLKNIRPWLAQWLFNVNYSPFKMILYFKQICTAPLKHKIKSSKTWETMFVRGIFFWAIMKFFSKSSPHHWVQFLCGDGESQSLL